MKLFFLKDLVAKEAIQPVLDPAKFTICSMTLNSTQERKVFEDQVKKFPDKFNPVVELTEFQAADKDWFDVACEQGIICDQLIISGHFSNAGKNFFGSSQKSLTLADLEKKSCAKTCEGILSHPYEVFALGCNTLEEAKFEPMKELLQNGWSPAEAQAQVEAKGGALGDSNKGSLLRAFGGERKQIYGYYASGPSGASVEKFLKKYFNSGSLVERLEKMQANRLMGKIDFINKDLASSLRSTNFSQCEGGGLYRDELNSLRCRILNTDLARKDRMSAVVEALSREDYLVFIPTINTFLEELSENYWDDETKAQFELISKNEELKKRILTLISKISTATTFRDYIAFAENMHFVDEEQKHQLIMKTFEKTIFKTNLTKDDVYEICFKYPDLVKSIALNEIAITKIKLKSDDFQVLRCLGDLSEQNKQAILIQLAKTKEDNILYVDADKLSSPNIKTQQIILDSISKSNPRTRYVFENALKQSKFDNNSFIKDNFKKILEFVMSTDTGLQDVGIALLSQKINDQEIQNAFLSELKEKNDVNMLSSLWRVLSKHPELQEKSYDQILALLPIDLDLSGSVLNLYMYLLKKHPSDDLKNKIKLVLRANSSSYSREVIINELLTFKLTNQEKEELFGLGEEGLSLHQKIEFLVHIADPLVAERMITLLKKIDDEDESANILAQLAAKDLNKEHQKEIWPILKSRLLKADSDEFTNLKYKTSLLLEKFAPLNEATQTDLLSLLNSKDKKTRKKIFEYVSGASTLPVKIGLKLASSLDSKNKEESQLAYDYVVYSKDNRSEYAPFLLRALEKHQVLNFNSELLAQALGRIEKIPTVYQDRLIKNIFAEKNIFNTNTIELLTVSLSKVENLSSENQIKILNQILNTENQDESRENRLLLNVFSNFEIKDPKVQLRLIETFNPENNKIPIYNRESLKSIAQKMKITDPAVQKLFNKYFTTSE